VWLYAIAVKHSTKPVLSYFAIASIGLLVMTGQLADIPLTLDTPYYAGIAVAAAHLAQQVCALICHKVVLESCKTNPVPHATYIVQ
jgi:hypothetical protein